MPKKKNKLWVPIDKIVESEANFLGTKYLVQISDTSQQTWVRSLDLSQGVAASYASDENLKKGAKARVNRSFFTARKDLLQTQSSPQDNAPAAASPEDPIKAKKKLSKWILMAQLYVEQMNTVLQTDPKSRHVRA